MPLDGPPDRVQQCVRNVLAHTTCSAIKRGSSLRLDRIRAEVGGIANRHFRLENRRASTNALRTSSQTSPVLTHQNVRRTVAHSIRTDTFRFARPIRLKLGN